MLTSPSSSGWLRLVLLAGLFGAAASAPARPPNIILLLPDQMRASAMGIAGNPDVQTPHIDRMARDGIRFKRTYANVPVCCPARAMLLTGTYPHVNGMVANDLRLRESETTIAELLRDAGYRTGFVGKWHLDGGPREPGYVPPGPRRQGFDFWAAYECHHQHFLPYYFRDTPEMILVRKYEPEASADFAVEFLKGRKGEQPFFLMMQMGPPHDPYGAPDDYMKRYDPAKLTLPASWQPNSENNPGGNAIPPKYRRPDTPGATYVRTGGREEIAAYYAAITAIDDQVGRLLQTLKETGQDENTIILFTSDHGDMLGSHGMRRKRKPYEESAGVPGILRWPATRCSAISTCRLRCSRSPACRCRRTSRARTSPASRSAKPRRGRRRFCCKSSCRFGRTASRRRGAGSSRTATPTRATKTPPGCCSTTAPTPRK